MFLNPSFTSRYKQIITFCKQVLGGTRTSGRTQHYLDQGHKEIVSHWLAKALHTFFRPQDISDRALSAVFKSRVEISQLLISFLPVVQRDLSHTACRATKYVTNMLFLPHNASMVRLILACHFTCCTQVVTQALSPAAAASEPVFGCPCWDCQGPQLASILPALHQQSKSHHLQHLPAQWQPPQLNRPRSIVQHPKLQL